MLSLLDYQQKPKDKLVQLIKSKQSSLLIAPTRTGKTYGICSALAESQSLGYLPALDINPEKLYSIVVICPKSVRIQTTRVLLKAGVKDFKVCSFREITSSSGQSLWLDITSNLEFVWRSESLPDIIWIDECQFVKNPSAQITQAILAYIAQGGLVIFSSATPFARICESECVCKGLKLCTSYGWTNYARDIAGVYSDPTDFNNAAMSRLNNALENSGKLLRYENIKYKHRTMNRAIAVDFRDNIELEKYTKIYSDLLERLRKHNPYEPQGIRAVWVEMLKWREASEILRAPRLAEQGKLRSADGNQVIIASNFIESLRSCWKALVKEQKISQDQIGFITGDLDDNKRQKFIDMFQDGKLDYLLLSIKAGGVGLSLHHELACARPRYVILPPCWSPYDYLQVLGRAHGPTSLSTTHQDTIWYKGTIEDRVKEKLWKKCDSLKEILTSKETFHELFLKEVSGNILTEELEKLADDFGVMKDEDGNKIEFSLEALE